MIVGLLNTSNNTTPVPGSLSELLPWQLRVCMSCYLILAIAFCCFSNTMIVTYVKKCRHVFLELDEVSLYLLNHLALSDLIFQVVRMVPMATTSIAGRWILGSSACFLNSVLKYAPISATLYLLITLTLIQVGRVGRSEEFITSRATRRRGRITVAVVWSLACASTLILALKQLDYWYEPWNIGCEMDETSTFKTLAALATLGVPLGMLLVLVATLIFLCFMCCPNSMDSRALLTVEVALLFIFLTAPAAGLKLWRYYGNSLPSWSLLAESLLYTGFVVLRPVLYTTVCCQFKEHLVNTLCCGRRRVEDVYYWDYQRSRL